jgi:hypothetical protein
MQPRWYTPFPRRFNEETLTGTQSANAIGFNRQRFDSGTKPGIFNVLFLDYADCIPLFSVGLVFFTEFLFLLLWNG